MCECIVFKLRLSCKGCPNIDDALPAIRAFISEEDYNKAEVVFMSALKELKERGWKEME